MRVGIGYDIHCLKKNNKLILGGVVIPYELGLEGHSDADVLLHSVCDALLGAAGLGDIGEHFPNNDCFYKDISSTILLRKAYKMVRSRGFVLENLDTTVFAQSPYLSPYKAAMKENISNILSINIKCTNIKATTTERLGLIGNGKGIASMCVALLT